MIWFSEHQPKLVGSSAAGFDITRMGWSREDFYDQRAFILKVLQLTIQYKAWNNYMISIDDEEAANKTRELITLFEELKIDDIHPGLIPFIFRAPDATAYRYCKVHYNTLLNDVVIASNQNCIVCGTTEIDESIGLTIREIKLEGEWASERLCLEIDPAVELDSKLQIYKIADRICRQKNLLLLGNKWLEIDYEWAQECISDGFTYDLAYNSPIDTDEIRSANIKKVETLVQNQEIICCLTNSEWQPLHHKTNGTYHTDLLYGWDFSFAYVIGCRNKVIFVFFWGSS